MNWVAWRQHRKQFLIFGIILALFAALLIPTGISFWHTYQHELASCAQNPANPSCSDLSNSLFQSTFDQILLHLIPDVTIIVLPLILGLFWGAPLLAKEYSENTNSLAWTQSVSRRKWLTVKMAWMLTATAVLVGAFATLITWWSKTPNALNMNRFDSSVFGSMDIVPVAFGLFTVAVGIMFGAWFRRTMLALGVTLGFVIAIAIVMPVVIRPHYMTPVTVTSPMGPEYQNMVPKGAWVLSRNIANQNGQAVGDIFPAAPTQCQQIIQQMQVRSGNGQIAIKVTPGAGNPVDTCLNKAGWHQTETYQPSYRYWDFQRIETVIYLGLAAIVIAATYWLVLKRDA